MATNEDVLGALGPWSDLSLKHRNILQLLEKGLESKEIGEELGYSPRTIDNNLSVIFGKFRCSNRTELAHIARKAGLFLDDDGYGPEGTAWLQLVNAFWDEGVKSGEMWRFLPFLTSGHLWKNDPAQEPIVSGLGGAEQIMGGYWRAFPDLEFKHKCTILGPNKIASNWEAEATHSGEFLGMKPTGLKLKFKGVTFSEIFRDKLCVSEVIWDLPGVKRDIQSRSRL